MVERKAAAKPKKLTKAQRRDADRRERIEAMPLDRVEKVLNKYAKVHESGYSWAVEMARKDLDVTEAPEHRANGWDKFLRRVYWWALKFHNRRQNWPDALTWAFDDEAVAAAEAVAAIRRQRVDLLTCKDGTEDETLKRMYKAINAMTSAARDDMAAEIKLRKPRIWATAFADAQNQLEQGDAEFDAVDHVRLALQYVVQHYRWSKSKQWPSFVVPPSLRPDVAGSARKSTAA